MDGVVGGLSPAAGTRTCMQDAPHVGDVTSAEHSVPKWEAGTLPGRVCRLETCAQGAWSFERAETPVYASVLSGQKRQRVHMSERSIRANHHECKYAASQGTLYRGTTVTRCLSLHRDTRVTPSLFPHTHHMVSNSAQGGRCSPCLVLSESAFFIGSRLIGAIVSSPWHSSTGPMAGLALHISGSLFKYPGSATSTARHSVCAQL